MAYSIFRPSRLIFNTLRSYSSEAKLVDVSVNDKTGIATVTMQRHPVNGLNLNLLKELNGALDNLNRNNSKGMILTSSLQTIFSAGLDIMEMYKPDSERLKLFWTTLQDVWMKLYSTPYPTVAAVNGHSPAGGCLLAMSCEYRIMANGFTIGLNETQLGIVAPFWFISTMKNTINSRDAELALTTGKLFKTDQALKVGLVDEVAVDKDEVLHKATKFFNKYVKINPLARSLTKEALRSKAVKELANNRKEDLERFLSFVNQPLVQKGLEVYMESLKKK